MSLELFVYYDGVNYPIDLSGVESFPLTYSVADIREPSARNASYSKTISIPGTQHNNKIFKQLFEISGESDWNVNKKVRCAVYQGGGLLFDGFIRVSNIKRKVNGSNNYASVVYECNVFGEMADFIKALGTSLLEDLDMSEYDHSYTLASIDDYWDIGTYNASHNLTQIDDDGNGFARLKTSTSTGVVAGDLIHIDMNASAGWNHYHGTYIVKEVFSSTEFSIYHSVTITGSTPAAVDVLTFTPQDNGIYYPMIDWGNNFGTTWNVTDFQPAISAKTYLDKIFASIGWSYDSDFLNSNFFKMLYIPFNDVYVTLSQAEIDTALFRAGRTSNVALATLNLGTGSNYTGSSSTVAKFDKDSPAPLFDNAGSWNTTTFEYTAQVTGYHSFNGLLSYSMTLTVDPYATHPFRSGIITSGYTLFKNGSAIYSQTAPVTYNSQTENIVLPFQTPDFILTAGDVITLEINQNFTNVVWRDAGFNTYTGLVKCDLNQKAESYMQCAITNPMVVEGGTMTMNNAIPRNIKQADFFVSLCKLFNLYVDSDKTQTKKLRIEPRDDYYSNNTTLDWTAKLDTAQEIEITPMAELNANRYIFRYKEDKDVFNQDHVRVYGRTYGEQWVDIDNDFVTGEYVTEPIFSATVLEDYPVGSDRIISTIQGDGEITRNRIASNIRILYASVRGCENTWTLSGTGGTLDYNYYPYAGHLDNVWMPVYDLNYGFPDGTYYNYTAWTNNNLYNKYYKKSIEEITDQYSKIVTAWFNLKANDIATLDFRNYIRVDNHLFRLNKVIDYDPVTPSLTQVELVKVLNNFRFVPVTETAINPADKTTFSGRLPNPVTQGNRPAYKDAVKYSQNKMMGSNQGVIVEGTDNLIGYGTKNSIIIGDNNIVGDNLENVVLIGVSGVTVTESNTVIIAGQEKMGYRTITSNSTMLTSDSQVFIDASGGNVKYEPLAPWDVEGMEFTVTRIDDSANTVNIYLETNGGTLNGETNILLAPTDSITFYSDGSNFYIV